mgnify:CR=1 FL=1
MSATNFLNNFTNGFMFGMLNNSNPFFGAGMGTFGGFGGFGGFGNFGGFGSCFSPQPMFFNACNSFTPYTGCCTTPFPNKTSLFMVPNVMSGASFSQLLPDINPPAFNFDFGSVGNNIFANNWSNQSFNTSFTPSNFQFNFTPPATNTPETKTETENETLGSSAKKYEKSGSRANKKLTDKYNGTAEQLNKQLNKKNGVLKNKGQVFLDAQEKYGVNAAILASIAIHETGYGTSNLAKTKNNVGGIRKGSGFKSYSSVDECIMDMARLLKQNYADKGLVTIAQVQQKYCPTSDPQDKKGLNSGWRSAVSGLVDKFETMA